MCNNSSQSKINLLDIFEPTTTNQHLVIVAKLGGIKIGTGDYTDSTPKPSTVKISGKLDYDGWGQHLHGPFNVSIVISDNQHCKLAFSGDNFPTVGPETFCYTYVKHNKFEVILDNYKNSNGYTLDGKLTFVGEGSNGTKINPDIDITPEGSHDSTHFDHGIKIEPKKLRRFVKSEVSLAEQI